MSFYERQQPEKQYNLIHFSKKVFEVASVPYKAMVKAGKAIDSMNRLDEKYRALTQKIRPPRFTSFNMQLEPYSRKKAYAVEILNDINLNVLQSESITNLFTIAKYVIIMTPKRIICVEEVGKGINLFKDKKHSPRLLGHNLA